MAHMSLLSREQRIGAKAFSLLAMIMFAKLSSLYAEVAMAQSCQQGQALEHQFDSGSSWTMCWTVDNASGLRLSNISYQAPTQPLRTVLASASIAQVIKHYDADIYASHWLPTPGLGASNAKTLSPLDCVNGELVQDAQNNQLCKWVRDINNLTRVRNTQSIRRHELALHFWSLFDGHTIEQVWRFSEDGEFTPTFRLGGIINRYTSNARYGVKVNQNELYAASASILVNWRLAFAIAGGPENDVVSEIDFPRSNTDVLKRPIRQSTIGNETQRLIDPENFRGWLVRDTNISAGSDNVTNIGYFFDPQSSGYRYASAPTQWTHFDIAFTNHNDCEQLASKNTSDSEPCGNSLNEFVNAEPLNAPVLWINATRRYTPSREDYPAMQNLEASFKLIPFDWSPYTTFSPEPE